MKRETTILYGNGVILLERKKTWKDLLKEIAVRDDLPEINNNTLLYEYLILPKPQNTKMILCDCNGVKIFAKSDQLIVSALTEELVKKRLKDKLVGGDNWFFDELVKMKADHYLTTNYEFQLNERFNIIDKIEYTKNKDREDLLYGYETGEKDGRKVTLWNIHGSKRVPDSILLGMNEYSEYVVAINKLFNNTKGKNWVDLFTTTDVHIIGFGLGYEEIDLWYILTSRMRRIKEGAPIDNKIYYYAIKDKYYDKGKNQLLEAAGVIVKDIDFDVKTENYDLAYHQIIEEYVNIQQSTSNT